MADNWNKVSLGLGSLKVNGEDVGFLKGDVKLTYEEEFKELKTGIPLQTVGRVKTGHSSPDRADALAFAYASKTPFHPDALKKAADALKDKGDLRGPSPTKFWDDDANPPSPKWWQKVRLPPIPPMLWRLPFCLLAAALLAYAEVYRWSLPLSYVLGGLCTLLLGYSGSKQVVGIDPAFAGEDRSEVSAFGWPSPKQAAALTSTWDPRS